jgi:hypothetical protein
MNMNAAPSRLHILIRLEILFVNNLQVFESSIKNPIKGIHLNNLEKNGSSSRVGIAIVASSCPTPTDAELIRPSNGGSYYECGLCINTAILILHDISIRYVKSAIELTGSCPDLEGNRSC